MKKIFYALVIIASMVLVSSCGNRKTASEATDVDSTEVVAPADTTETVAADTAAVATTAE